MFTIEVERNQRSFFSVRLDGLNLVSLIVIGESIPFFDVEVVWTNEAVWPFLNVSSLRIDQSAVVASLGYDEANNLRCEGPGFAINIASRIGLHSFRTGPHKGNLGRVDADKFPNNPTAHLEF
jgi:hypothetical protein